MSTHNIGFYGDLTKIIFELNYHQISSNTHLITSAGMLDSYLFKNVNLYGTEVFHLVLGMVMEEQWRDYQWWYVSVLGCCRDTRICDGTLLYQR